jgi:hypothetical protein
LRTAFFVVLFASASACFAQTNVLMFRNDGFHTGQNLTETTLTPANVNSTRFGKLLMLPADGKVDGQPLYVAGLNMPDHGIHNVVFMASEHDTVYAYDADYPGDSLWHVSVLQPGETPADPQGCSQIEPEIGISATPVIDLSAGVHGTMYLVSMSKDSAGGYHQRLHALDITSGDEQFGGPVEISATFPGNGDAGFGGLVYFDPRMYKDRSALVLSDGVLYTSWASNCDARPYTGWVIGYDQYSLTQSLVYNFTPDGEGGSIWGGGAGPALDPQGHLFFQLANGTFDGNLDVQGFPVKGDFGNAFVNLSVEGRVPKVLDYWTMHNSEMESDADVDLGSGGVMLLPDVVDANGAVRHLGTGAGKDGNVYVFDRDNMGKFNPGADNTLYQELPGALGNSEFASPAWFNGTVYYGAAWDYIRAFSITDGTLSASTVMTPGAFAYPGTTPSVSANGASNGILWAIENNGVAVLHAYDAGNIARELYNSGQAGRGRDYLGAGSKWIPPTIADGRVFVPTASGVAVFGLLQRRGPIVQHPR